MFSNVAKNIHVQMYSNFLKCKLLDQEILGKYRQIDAKDWRIFEVLKWNAPIFGEGLYFISCYIFIFYSVRYYDVQVSGESSWLSGRYETDGEVNGQVR